MKKLLIPKGKEILIIAPHPDDETFCCSGILINYARQCDVVLLTDGGLGNPDWSQDRTARIRKKEFVEVMRSLGVHRYITLGIKDGKVNNNKKYLLKIPYEKYDYIFVPNRYDKHSDHKCIYHIVKKACKWRHSHAYLFEYEMWGTFRNATHYMDLSNIMVRKQELMQMYKSQNIYIDYSKRIQALNYYRAIELKNISFVECYFNEKSSLIPHNLLHNKLSWG